MKHIEYFKYVIRHKLFTFIACTKIGASWRLGLTHDLSKFRPSEWFPYVEWFYGELGIKNQCPAKWSSEAIRKVKHDFDTAWLHHQKRNKHHWQYWVLTLDSKNNYGEKIISIPMPKKYVLEMVADWMGAGRAIHGKWEVVEWYDANKHSMDLHPETKDRIEYIFEMLSMREPVIGERD